MYLTLASFLAIVFSILDVHTYHPSTTEFPNFFGQSARFMHFPNIVVPSDRVGTSHHDVRYSPSAGPFSEQCLQCLAKRLPSMLIMVRICRVVVRRAWNMFSQQIKLHHYRFGLDVVDIEKEVFSTTRVRTVRFGEYDNCDMFSGVTKMKSLCRHTWVLEILLKPLHHESLTRIFLSFCFFIRT